MPSFCILFTTVSFIYRPTAGRFEKRIFIPLPEAEARTYMFKLNIGDTPHNVSDSEFDQLGARSEG